MVLSTYDLGRRAPPLAEHLAALGDAITRILDTPASVFTPDATRDALEEFLRQGNRLEAARLHLVGILADHTTQSDTVDFLSAVGKVSRTRAKHDVELARMTDQLIEWDGAIGGLHGDRGALQLLGAAAMIGNATREHLDQARIMLGNLPTNTRRGTLTSQVEFSDGTTAWRTDVKSKVIDGFFTAVASKFAPAETKDLTRDLLETLGHDRPDRGDPDSESRRCARWSWANGVRRLTLDFDDKSAVQVQRLIAAASAPEPLSAEGTTDDRSQGQREFDAVVDLLTAGANADPAVRPNATVIVHATVDQVLGAPDAGAAVVEGRGAISKETLAFLGCDANLRTVITDTAGVPLLLTVNDRYATPKQRQVLTARDRGCVAPGCGADSSICHAHHVVFARHGGPTELTNLVLLCPRHHRQLHSGSLEVRFAEDGMPQARWIRSGWPGRWQRNEYQATAAEARRIGTLLRDDGRT